jgi:hypothetical protein
MEQKVLSLEVYYDYIMEMIINRSIHSGYSSVFNRCSLPIQKAAHRPFLDLISLGRGLKGVRRVEEKSP